MRSLIFATGNDEKFGIAVAACRPAGITISQRKLDIDEIQGEDSELIIRDKTRKAFAIVQAPVVVSDDSWSIPGLRGFPGPYMKSINHWFTMQDFLNLTRPLADRRIILVQLLAYGDGSGQHVIRREHTATLLPEARGHYGSALQKIVAMPGDTGLSIAEAYDRGAVHAERDAALCWQDMTRWLAKERPAV